jgi:hypothetical protein
MERGQSGKTTRGEKHCAVLPAFTANRFAYPKSCEHYETSIFGPTAGRHHDHARLPNIASPWKDRVCSLRCTFHKSPGTLHHHFRLMTFRAARSGNPNFD